MKYVVIAEWCASYPNPIQLQSGEPVLLNGQKDRWDGYLWLWAKSAGSGLEGWVPDNIVRSGTAGPVANTDYSAVELSCCKNELLTSINETHGWAYCVNAHGQTGWVPLRNLVPA